MKILIAITLFALVAVPLWAELPPPGIVVGTDDSNPLNAQGYSSLEPDSDLNGIDVTFNYGFLTRTSAFQSSGPIAQATDLRGLAEVSAPLFTPNGTWSVQNSLGNLNLLGITFVGMADSTGGNSGIGFFADATCSDSLDMCPVPASANYASPVEINGGMSSDPSYYDLTITFEDGGLMPGSTFSFDMNTQALYGQIAPAAPSAATPEPASIFMLLGGLCCVGGVARFRRRTRQNA